MAPAEPLLVAGRFKNKRGQSLYSVSFMPPVDPVAHLYFHHGLAEHIRRYDRVFKQMARAGIAVHALDAHGHGRSEPHDKADRALVHKFDDLVDDLYEVVDRVCTGTAFAGTSLQGRQLVRDAPFFVGGHSMGGLVAAHAALRSQPLWSGLLLHSAAVDVEWTPMLRFQAKVGGLMAALIPKARIVPAVRPADMSQDPEVVEAYVKDPLNTVGSVCARTGNELLGAFRRLVAAQKELRLPVYAAHGSHDACTSLPAAQRLVKECSSSDTTFHIFPGGYHELLHGPESEDATQRMVEWMLKRVVASHRSRL